MIHAPCAVCGGDEPTPAFDVGRWHVVACGACGHRYVDPRPDGEVLRTEVYHEHYFANPAFHATDGDAYHGYMDYRRDRPHIEARLREVLDHVEAKRAPGRLLDVGCGFGFFVALAQRSGWDAWGAELNHHAVAWGREHVTDRVVEATVDDLPFEDASMDLVTLFDVIEHLPDPAHDLVEVARVLRPGGHLVVATPDAGSLAARVLGARWLEVQRAPEHLHFFDVPGLSRLLANAGFAAIEWHTMGKITSVRTVLADLKFSAPRLFHALERGLDRLGAADRVVDVDPRTKFCVYARKGDQRDPTLPVRIQRRRPVLRLLGSGVSQAGPAT
ncbi:MAG TPA: class I SAM-dependent methyltransferase [Nitriliruptorales bacterium]